MPRIFNNLKLKERRRILRNNQTKTEKILWQILRKKQVEEIKFCRQYGIGQYIADFYAPSIKLVIEIDGDNHYSKIGREYDVERDSYMRSLNITILRIPNIEVKKKIEIVIEKIIKTVTKLKG